MLWIVDEQNGMYLKAQKLYHKVDLAVYQHMVTQVSLSHGFITNIARMI
jgi:hypothetical protein